MCILAPPRPLFSFFALICGGEVRSLGGVDGLVPLRFVVNPSRDIARLCLCRDWGAAHSPKTEKYLPDAEQYGRRPYPFGGKFGPLFLGEFASFDWFLEALVFCCFLWAPYFLRNLFFAFFPLLYLSRSGNPSVGPGPSGPNRLGSPIRPPIRFCEVR